MKKLFFVLCLFYSLNSYAEAWEKICSVDYEIENNVYPWESVMTIYKDGDVHEEKSYNNLLSICDKGDILSVTIYERNDLPLKKIMVSDMIKTTNAQLISSIFIGDYCDLKETVIVSDSLLVCRLEER